MFGTLNPYENGRRACFVFTVSSLTSRSFSACHVFLVAGGLLEVISTSRFIWAVHGVHFYE